MKAKDLIMGGVFFSVVMIALLGFFLTSGDAYSAVIPPEFSNSFSRFDEFQNITETASLELQQDTFNVFNLGVAFTSGLFSFIKLLVSVPAIIYSLAYDIQVLLGFPTWVAHFLNVLLFLTVILIGFRLISKVPARDD